MTNLEAVCADKSTEICGIKGQINGRWVGWELGGQEGIFCDMGVTRMVEKKNESHLRDKNCERPREGGHSSQRTKKGEPRKSQSNLQPHTSLQREQPNQRLLRLS